MTPQEFEIFRLRRAVKMLMESLQIMGSWAAAHPPLSAEARVELLNVLEDKFEVMTDVIESLE